VREKLTARMPYAIVLAITYYVLPLLIRDTGLAMLIMLCVMPMLTLCCAVVCGVRHGFDLLLPLAAAALFTPTIFVFYNESAWIYVVVHALLALVGTGIGSVFYGKR